jgi:murein lipoprotein
MPLLKNRPITRAAAVIVLGGFSLGACVSQQKIDEQFSTLNTRIDQLDAQVQSAAQQAGAANQAAQSANQAAQAAASDARNANQRLDAIDARINQLEQGPTRTPRG